MHVCTYTCTYVCIDIHTSGPLPLRRAAHDAWPPRRASCRAVPPHRSALFTPACVYGIHLQNRKNVHRYSSFCENSTMLLQENSYIDVLMSPQTHAMIKTLHHAASLCTTLHHTALHIWHVVRSVVPSDIRQHIAQNCNTLQHTLQYTAIHFALALDASRCSTTLSRPSALATWRAVAVPSVCCRVCCSVCSGVL